MRTRTAPEEKIEDGLAVVKTLDPVVQSGPAQVLLDQPRVPRVVFRDQYDDFTCCAHGSCWLRRGRQGNKKCGALAGFRFDPDLSLLPLQDALRDGQAKALALARPWIQADEKSQTPWPGVRARCRCRCRARRRSPGHLREPRDCHEPWIARLQILDRVVEQIREDLVHLCRVAKAIRQRFDLSCCAGVLNLELHRLHDAGEQGIHSNRSIFKRRAAEP